MRARRVIELLLLLALAAAVLAPVGLALLLLPALTVAWWTVSRPPRRELAVVLLGTGVAVAALVVAFVVSRPVSLEPSVLAERLSPSWQKTLDQLSREASELAAAWDATGLEEAPRRDLFSWLDEELGARGRRPGGDEMTALVVDGNGEAVVWAGPGLRNDPPPESIPRQGWLVRRGFSSISVAAVAPVEEESVRPWRVLVGRSHGTTGLPFSPPFGWRREGIAWSVSSPAEAPPDGLRVPGPEDRPALAVRLPLQLADLEMAALTRRIAVLALGLALLVLVVLRQVSVVLIGAAVPPLAHRVPWHDACLMAAALLLVLWAAGAPLAPSLLCGVIVGSVLVALHHPWLSASGRRVLAAQMVGLGVAGALALLVVPRLGPLDLGETLFGGLRAVIARVTLWASVLAGLLAARRIPESRSATELAPWSSFLLLAGAACLTEWEGVVAVTSLLAMVILARWLADRRSVSRVAVVCLLAALQAAVAWESYDRWQLERRLAGPSLTELLPAEPVELETRARDLTEAFSDIDLHRIALGDPSRISEQQDLAHRLWLESPLSGDFGLSALVVAPLEGQASSFSYGLPRSEVLALANGVEATPELWSRGVIDGRVPLLAGGESWGTIRYRLLLRPTRPTGSASLRPATLGAELLQGEPRPGLPAPWPGGALILDAEGSLVAASEPEPPILDPLPESGSQVEAVGAKVWHRRASDGTVAVVWLERAHPMESLARTAVHACGTLLVLLVATAIAVLLALPRPAVRDRLWRELRSYSRRPVVVFTLLVLLPLAGLNLLLFRTLEDRSRSAQRAGGEDALRTAQTILVDYLTSLEPGYTIDNAVDDQLLGWLSSVVRHEVNLYWRGYVYAASRPDLFTAGLMPRRIPGPVFADLSLGGRDVAVRSNRLDPETRYLEVYGPIRLPGEGPTGGRLFLSVPLLAQQLEAEVELGRLQRQAIAVTTAIFLLLLTVGARLARSFTRPLAEIVTGTERIAAGAESLPVRPDEPELGSLAAAIDDMARRIAEGRRRLQTEKRVLEGIVENVTSAVVSFDRDGRVLMRNRAAQELLEVAVGDRLVQIARTPGLEELAAFLDGEGEKRERVTVQVRGEASDPRSQEQEWTAVWVPVPGQEDPAALLVVEDVSEVLRAQRLEAWAEMARLIAHEVKNPLTPIRLSTEHLQRVWSSDRERLDEVFARCTGNILEQVAELQETVRDFATYSDILRAEPVREDLAAIVGEVVAAYAAAPPEGVRISARLPTEPLVVELDRRLISRSVRNLIENAIQASVAGGEIEVTVALGEGGARIEVADRGPGVREELLARIFDPYFSTSTTGSGLGLPIARRVAEAHGGRLEASNRAGGGLLVTMTIPLA